MVPEITMLGRTFYIIPEEVFRVGSARSSLLSRVRRSDVDMRVANDIPVVIANGRGVSVYTEEQLKKAPLTGWVWRFPPGIRLPEGLRMVNDRPGHYCVAPARDMPADLYVGLLEAMAIHATRVWKKSA